MTSSQPEYQWLPHASLGYWFGLWAWEHIHIIIQSPSCRVFWPISYQFLFDIRSYHLCHSVISYWNFKLGLACSMLCKNICLFMSPYTLVICDPLKCNLDFMCGDEMIYGYFQFTNVFVSHLSTLKRLQGWQGNSEKYNICRIYTGIVKSSFLSMQL